MLKLFNMRNVIKIIIFIIPFSIFLFEILTYLGLTNWVFLGCIDPGFYHGRYKCMLLEKSILIFIPLLFTSLGIFFFFKRFNKEKLLLYLFSIPFILFVTGLFYYNSWKENCRAFPKNYNLPKPMLGPTELKCPLIINPFGWKQFDKDWRLKNNIEGNTIIYGN